MHTTRTVESVAAEDRLIASEDVGQQESRNLRRKRNGRSASLAHVHALRAEMIRAECARTGPTAGMSGNGDRQERPTQMSTEIRPPGSQPPNYRKAATRRQGCRHIDCPKAEPHQRKNRWHTGSRRRAIQEVGLGPCLARRTRSSNTNMPETPRSAQLRLQTRPCS